MNAINDNTFYKLSTPEIINLRNEGLLNTQSFIYFYLRSLDPFGNQSINIDRQQFCQQFGISLSSFKRAVKKLKELKAFKFVKSILVTSEPEGVKSEPKRVKNEPEGVKSEPLANSQPLSDKGCGDSKIKDIKIKDNKLEEKEKKENDRVPEENNDRVVIDNQNKVTIQKIEVAEDNQIIDRQIEVVENEPLPEKPHEHEPLIRFVATEFVTKYNESRERARENAIKHLSKRDKAIKKWREYQKHIQAKSRSDRRHQELIERKRKEQELPVNTKALELLSQFTKTLSGKRSRSLL